MTSQTQAQPQSQTVRLGQAMYDNKSPVVAEPIPRNSRIGLGNAGRSNWGQVALLSRATEDRLLYGRTAHSRTACPQLFPHCANIQPTLQSSIPSPSRSLDPSAEPKQLRTGCSTDSQATEDRLLYCRTPIVEQHVLSCSRTALIIPILSIRPSLRHLVPSIPAPKASN
jgi:hypothetical protein